MRLQQALVTQILEDPKMMFGREPRSLDDERYFAMKRIQAMEGIEVLKPENMFASAEKLSKGVHILQTWDPSLLIKLSIGVPMAISVLQSLGTKRHEDLIPQILTGEVLKPHVSKSCRKSDFFVDCDVFLSH